ncbi:prephenate dehydratase [Acetivibrio clariflavus]|uniref:Prephenate dehydratase n=1 Tax=Acetivibrio clariflavus (strain DSM 19732 / NBRC 101661 / EBR45) TaxID=720554 RepID=G8M065_ACECE|nr:prephenate dehydratase [Acetivibrio clariflavus]AEV66872.1 prephenate dehydratase [Acetivibrio clariflavus DSM 19732]
MLKIGFLGPKGTFSQEALLEYKKGEKDFVECAFNTFGEIINAVNKDEIDEGIVPIENSLEGAVNATLDTLATDVDLLIKAEIAIEVKQNLLVRKGTNIENIKYIISHPQPIGQCRNYLETNFNHAEIRFLYSTAEAARQVAECDFNMAAIGSLTAAKVYGLDVIAEGIQDSKNNYTRFVVVSKTAAEKAKNNKTSIVFSTEDKPGSLYRILDIFNLWDINMTRIESRPAKDKLGNYIFFVDLKGHIEDDDVRDALTMVKRKTSFYKFLGSYPEFVIK